MISWCHDDHTAWCAALAGMLFPGCENVRRPDLDWSAMEEIVDAHRLAPWIHARSVETRPSTQSKWQAEAHDAAVRALQMQQDLAELIDLLAPHGIDPIALKGLPLSLLYYDQPWHRPMRDIDLLIEERDALLRAWSLMIGAGFTPYDDAVGDPEAILDDRHQLPPLLSPTHGTPVELHQRAGHAQSAAGPTPTLHCTLLGWEVRVPTPEALLIHLVAHAARDHRFDNGPQVLIDLAMLHAASIDLGAALENATEIGWIATSRYYGRWPPMPFPA